MMQKLPGWCRLPPATSARSWMPIAMQRVVRRGVRYSRQTVEEWGITQLQGFVNIHNQAE